MRLTCFALKAATATATAKKVLPVPAGPTPMVMVFFLMASIYFFWPRVLAFTGFPFEVMQTQSLFKSLPILSSSPSLTSVSA